MTKRQQLTDRQIRQLYSGLVCDYQKCLVVQNPPMTLQQIYNILYYGVYHAVNAPDHPFNALPDTEKNKVYLVLNTFFAATWQFRKQVQPRVCQYYYAGPPPPYEFPRTHLIIIQERQRRPYCCHDDFLFNVMLWSMIINYRPMYVGHSSSRTHHHPSQNKSSASDALVILIFVVLAAVVLALTFIAFYYLLSMFSNNLERLLFNEGWVQSCLSLLSITACGAGIGILTATFAGAPLTSLAFAIGLSNPIGLIVTAIICLSIIGAAGGAFISDQIQKYTLKRYNPDAFDTTDPHRYQLTPKEALALEKKGLDPIKIKCAILALRAEIGDQTLPSPVGFPWLGFRTDKMQTSMNKIRNLRQGRGISLDNYVVTVGDMHFDCRLDEHIFHPPEMLPSLS